MSDRLGDRVHCPEGGSRSVTLPESEASDRRPTWEDKKT